jgi:hypothetical protein
MKITKTSIIILTAGLLLAAGLGLGMTLNNRTAEKDAVAAELELAKQKLESLDNNSFSQQIADLNSQIEDSHIRAEETLSNLDFPIDNIDIVKAVISAASENELDLLDLNTQGSTEESLNGVTFQCITLNLTLEGSTHNLARFACAVQSVFPTVIIKSVNLDIAEPAPQLSPTATPTPSPDPDEIEPDTISLTLTIYDREDEDDVEQ